MVQLIVLLCQSPHSRVEHITTVQVARTQMATVLAYELPCHKASYTRIAHACLKIANAQDPGADQKDTN